MPCLLSIEGNQWLLATNWAVTQQRHETASFYHSMYRLILVRCRCYFVDFCNVMHMFYLDGDVAQILSHYVNWNKHPVPVPPSSRLIHYELQHSCVTSCRKSWCESCWYSCNCEGPPVKIHFSIDLSNCYSCNDVIMYICDCQFHLNHANWHLSSFSTQNGSDCEQVVF